VLLGVAQLLVNDVRNYVIPLKKVGLKKEDAIYEHSLFPRFLYTHPKENSGIFSFEVNSLSLYNITKLKFLKPLFNRNIV